MKLAITAALVASALALPAVASAQDQWSDYSGSVAYTNTDVSSGGPKLGAVTGRLSWKSNMFWGLEGEGSGGVKKDTIAGKEYKLNSQFAGYVTATAPLMTNLDIFARVGYGTTKITATPLVGSSTNQSWNYGVGGDWYWDANNGLRADYLRENFQKGGTDANVWSVGYVRRF